MADNMAIGPALAIGGNKVEMTQQGKIQVTTPKGKIKTLSQDQFKKQLIKNADKIQNGEDFEFKKDKKGLKIAAAVVATAAVVTGVIYRKEIGKYMKDFSFKKLWNDFKGLFKSKNNKGVKDAANAAATDTKAETKVRTIFDGEKTANATIEGNTPQAVEARLTSKETIDLKNKTIGQAADADAKAFEKRAAELKANHANTEADLKKVFKDYDPVKFKKGQVLENAGLTKEQYQIVKRHSNPDKVVKFTDKEKAVLPKWIQDSETCQRYTNSIEAQFAKIDEMFPKAVPAKK